MMAIIRIIGAFVAASIVTVLLGSIFSTQLVLADLQELGVEVPLDVRLKTTLQDIVGLAPLFGSLVSAGLAIAFVAGGLLYWIVRFGYPVIFTVAGAVAVLTIMLLLEMQFGWQVFAAARSTAGLGLLALSGAMGGLVFALLSRKGD